MGKWRVLPFARLHPRFLGGGGGGGLWCFTFFCPKKGENLDTSLGVRCPILFCQIFLESNLTSLSVCAVFIDIDSHLNHFSESMEFLL